jgi:zinc transport system permease protein
MAVMASLVGVLSVTGGLYGSLQWDTPSGPSIVVACALLFALSQSPINRLFSRGRKTKEGAQR